MAIGFGGPSEYLYQKVKRNFTTYLVVFIGTLILIFLVFSYLADPYRKSGLSIWFSLFVFYLFSLYWIVIFLKKRLKSNTYFRGGVGEANIKDLLESFSGEYAYFRGVAIEKTPYDIDYILVGPQGIYTIEVKSHSGYISFENGELLRNGQSLEKDFLKQSLNQALYIHNYLLKQLRADLFITPVIVFSSYYAKPSLGLNKIENVYVIQRKWLKKLVKSQPNFRYPLDRRLIENELKKLVKNPD